MCPTACFGANLILSSTSIQAACIVCMQEVTITGLCTGRVDQLLMMNNR